MGGWVVREGGGLQLSKWVSEQATTSITGCNLKKHAAEVSTVETYKRLAIN